MTYFGTNALPDYKFGQFDEQSMLAGKFYVINKVSGYAVKKTYSSADECYMDILAKKLSQIEILKEEIKLLSVAYSNYKEENDDEVVDESNFGRKFS